MITIFTENTIINKAPIQKKQIIKTCISTYYFLLLDFDNSENMANFVS